MAKKCIVDNYYDKLRIFITGLHVSDVFSNVPGGGKIVDIAASNLYFANNANKKKLIDARTTIKNKTYSSDFMKNEFKLLVNETNKFFKGAIWVGCKDLNTNMLTDGLSVVKEVKGELQYDVKNIITGLTSYSEDPFKIAADFNKENLYKIIGKNTGPDMKRLQDLLNIPNGNLSGDDMLKLEMIKKGIYTMAGFDTDGSVMKILKMSGNTGMYFGAQVLSSVLTGGTSYITSFTISQIVPRFSRMFTNEKSLMKINGDIGKLRKTFGILFSDSDSFVGNGKLDWIKHQAGWFNKKVGTGLFNFPDIVREGYKKNRAVEQVLLTDQEYLRFHGDIKEINNYFSRLKIENPEAFTKEIYRLDEMSRNVFRGDTFLSTTSDAQVFTSGSKKIRHFFTGFLTGRAKDILGNAIDTIKNIDTGVFNGRIRHEYLDMLENYGKVAADQMILDSYIKNESFLKMMYGIRNAVHYAMYSEKYNRSLEGKDFTKKELIDRALSFTFIGNAIQTIPGFRVAINTIANSYAVFLSGEYKGETYDKMKTVAITTLSNMFKEGGKRFMMPKAIIAAVGKAKTTGELFDLIGGFRDGVIGAAGGYMYFGADNLIKDGIKFQTPYTYNSSLRIFGLGNNSIDKYVEANTKKTITLLISDFGNKRESYLKYRLPFVKDWLFGITPDKETYKLVQEAYKKDETAKAMVSGIFPKNVNGLGEYSYNKMTELVKYKKNQRWFEDMAALFQTKKGYTLFNKQWQEDAFSNMMYGYLKNNNKEGFIEAFKKAKTTDSKFFRQLIGFIEANKPGSGKEVLGYLMNNENYELMKKYNIFKYDKSIRNEKGKFIKEMLGNKYGPLMYVTDKQNRFNAELYYLREKYDGLKKILTNPVSSKGYNSLDISILSGYKGKGDDGDEYDKKSTSARRLMLIDFYSDIMIASGNINGDKLLNVMGTLWNDNYYDIKSNPDYLKQKMSFINDQFAKIDERPISKQEKNVIKKAYLVWSKNTLDYLTKNPYVRRRYQKEYETTMGFLYGTIKEGLLLKDELNAENDYEKYISKNGLLKTTGNKSDKDYNYKKSGGGYSSKFNKNYGYVERMNSGTNSIFRAMQYDFRPLNNKYVKPIYGSRSYSQKDRDYLEAYGEARSRYYRKYRNYGKDYSKPRKPKDPEKRMSYQKQGYAVPPRLREMPWIYKETDRGSQQTLKQGRIRKGVKYDAGRARISVIKGSGNSGIVSKRSKGSNRSGSKRRSNRGSKNKTSNNKRNK